MPEAKFNVKFAAAVPPLNPQMKQLLPGGADNGAPAEQVDKLELQETVELTEQYMNMLAGMTETVNQAVWLVIEFLT
ncbi:UNKNOWN [Stylonychia lemnae]|uniref:Uncharacterized protein n=1 Tax=Stylonychia lemnae TaxID=5949 RepID=A0A078AK40_STYLE|nr:UNKNOWN [Stylonychia lemnae]|eukprot:CDW81822.1 UNKNOWN [Stylonychia lemnae]